MKGERKERESNRNEEERKGKRREKDEKGRRKKRKRNRKRKERGEEWREKEKKEKVEATDRKWRVKEGKKMKKDEKRMKKKRKRNRKRKEKKKKTQPQLSKYQERFLGWTEKPFHALWNVYNNISHPLRVYFFQKAYKENQSLQQELYSTHGMNEHLSANTGRKENTFYLPLFSWRKAGKVGQEVRTKKRFFPDSQK
jgi:hypothetical protein